MRRVMRPLYLLLLVLPIALAACSREELPFTLRFRHAAPDTAQQHAETVTPRALQASR